MTGRSRFAQCVTWAGPALTSVSIVCALGDALPLALVYLEQQILDSYWRGSTGIVTVLVVAVIAVVCIGAARAVSVYVREGILATRREHRSEQLLASWLEERTPPTHPSESGETGVLDSLTEEFDRGWVGFVSSGVSALGAMAYALYINVWFGLAAAGLLAAAMWGAHISTRSMPELGARAKDSSEKFLRQHRSMVDSLGDFKLMGYEGRLLSRFRQLDRDYLAFREKLDRAVVRANAGGVVAYGVQKLALILFLSILYATRQITPGGLVAGVFLVTLLSQPIVFLTRALAQIRGSESLFAALETAGISQDIQVESDDAGVSFQVGSLRAGDGSELAAETLLAFSWGEVSALVGDNGAGKSTFLDGVYWALVRAGVPVSYLDQSAELFPGTVASNLEWSEDPPKARSIWTSVDGVGRAESVIDGSARGVSAGQRQKALVARTLAGGRRVILLDEAFRSLDPPSTRTLLASVRGVVRQSGSLVICSIHDKELLTSFDRVIQVAEGRIEEEPHAVSPD